MASIHEVRDAVRAEYERLWNRFFRNIDGAKPAELVVEESEAASGYSKGEDKLWIRLQSGDLWSPDILKPDSHPVWRRELLHEITHEYQYKSSSPVSPGGTALHGKYLRRNFTGCGHDADFYTAICTLAQIMGYSEDDYWSMI